MIHATRTLNQRDKAMIQAALNYQDETVLDSVLEAIKNRSCAFMRVNRSIVILRPIGMRIHICQAAGSLADVDEVVMAAEIIARQLNLTSITIDGRKGWTKVLKKYGFKVISGQGNQTHYRKEL